MKSKSHATYSGQADDIADFTARHFTFLDMLDFTPHGFSPAYFTVSQIILQYTIS